MTSVALAFVLATLSVSVQHHDHAAGKSALNDTQVKQLLAGEGMGMAVPAEANGYPGPKHVLELADALQITPDQRAQIQASFDRMQADARALGQQIVHAEGTLFAAFQSKRIDAAEIERLTMEIATLQAKLRARHLKAHLETVPVLTPEQVARYVSLRK
jgi:Spy/CpxP family protein refolding chaperone